MPKDAKTVLLILVAIVFGLFLLWLFTGGPSNFNVDSNWFQIISFNSSPSSGNRNSNKSAAETDLKEYNPKPETIVLNDISYIKSPWYGQVEIRRGSAAKTYQPGEEYIILEAGRRNKEAINITGWVLENNASKRLHPTSGTAFKGISKRISIPAGSNYFLARQGETTSSILLEPGFRAIVTTGTVPNIFDIPIKVSFRTNICTGYLNDITNYDFKPTLKRNCPDPEKELSQVVLENKCYDYIDSLRRCHTPDTDSFRNRDGELVTKHLDKVTGLSNQCRSFVFGHYSYHSCIANHLSDPDFLGTEWRIYLKQNFELWVEDHEVITLYDAQNRLVDQLSY